MILDRLSDSLRNDSLQKVMRDSMDKVMNTTGTAADTTSKAVDPGGVLSCVRPLIKFLSGLTPAQLMAFEVTMAVIGLVMIVSMWKIFTKAGRPGWAILIPIYNIVTLIKVSGRPGWWIFLWILVVPILFLPFDMAKSFGKSTGFAIGLLFFGLFFYPILAFGSAVHVGKAKA